MKRRRTLTLRLGLFTLLLAGCMATRQTGDVTIDELFAHPTKFQGQRVAVVGYYESGIEDSSLYNTRNQTDVPLNKDKVFTRSIWVDGGSLRLTHRYVRVVGVFHYNPNFRRTIETRADGRKFESIDTHGYGHMGSSPAELADVTFFRPLR
jgi:hypothetical protein